MQEAYTDDDKNMGYPEDDTRPRPYIGENLGEVGGRGGFQGEDPSLVVEEVEGTRHRCSTKSLRCR